MIKGRIVGFALLAVALSTIVVFAISNFIQPLLPSPVNSTVVLLVASFAGVLGALAAFNDIVELFHKLFEGRRDRQLSTPDSNSELGEHSLILYPHRNPPYNAAKMLYVGPEIAKDLDVRITYSDSTGNLKTKMVTEFFPKQDHQMIWYHYRYDFLEPNQVAYFHLLKKKSTLDGKATVIASFTGAKSGKSVKVRKDFELEDF